MRRLILTFFYSGLSPIAPGTVGSLAASFVLYAAYFVISPSFLTWQLMIAGLLVFACYFSICFGMWAVVHFKRKDPQMFVLDEVAGICLSNLFLPIHGSHAIVTLAAAFVAFRLFDILKPPPAKQLEILPFGWGILCDDLAAAVYANLLCQVLLRTLS